LPSELTRIGDGSINVVFHFSGSLLRPGFVGIKVGRFVAKENLMEMRVPVPPNALSSSDFVQRYVHMLKDAIVQAKEVFEKKGIPFCLKDHLALVDKSLEGLGLMQRE
jgi:hypothetical protein